MRLSILGMTVLLAVGPTAVGAVLVSQQPGGGSVPRSSQLWQDPGPNGNDLDSDAICWEDFVLSAPASINHIEWWGAGACELGFRIEVWRQDPGTIAYQPLAVFDVHGGNLVEPEARFVVTPADYTVSAGPNGTTHFSLDLTTPIVLPANDAANPRWFIGIIGYTHQAFYTWNWSQGIGGSNRTYQWLRADGGRFWSLPEGRAMVLAENACVGASIGLQPVSVLACSSGVVFFDVEASGSGAMSYQWRRNSVPLDEDPGHIEGVFTPNLVVAGPLPSDIGMYDCVITNDCGTATSEPASLGLLPDFNGDGEINGADLSVLLSNFGDGYPGIAGDANGDNMVNGADLSVLIGSFGQTCW